jgi:translation initiation factor IF-3
MRRIKPSEIVRNDEIRAIEVRVVGMLIDDDPDDLYFEETSDIISLQNAITIAEQRGFDVILTNADQDPPLVKLCPVGKYVSLENELRKDMRRNAKVPKIKEIKMAYNIQEGDIQVRIKNMKRWMTNKKQQVSVKIVLKGRSRMFEGQARALLVRFQEEVSSYAKCAGATAGDPIISKDKRGDLMMMFTSGADTSLMKRLKEEGRLPGVKKEQGEEEGEAQDDEDDEEESNEPEEIKALLDQIEDLTAELKECGLKPNDIAQDDEMRELRSKLAQERQKMAAA